MKWVDPRSPLAYTNVLVGIVRIWWREFALAQVTLVFFVRSQAASLEMVRCDLSPAHTPEQSVFSFAELLGTNRLLASLEDPAGAVVRPWVWVVVLGSGPALTNKSIDVWVYYTSKPTRQAEALLLQLFFDHSLRLRLTVRDCRLCLRASTATLIDLTAGYVRGQEGL